MNITNIKKMKSEKGFTIVELLIVIVVIGILAAIVIVAYNGVQSRAKTTRAQTNAASVQKIAEAFNADKNYYPGAIADFTASTAKLPTGITIVSAIATPFGLTIANGDTNVSYERKGGLTSSTGGIIHYWDFTTGNPSTTVIYVGDATSADLGTVVAVS